MAKFVLKKELKKLLRSPKRLVILCILLVLSTTLVFANKGLWRHIQLSHEVSQQQAKQRDLDTAEKALSKEVEQLKNGEPQLIERIAREKYGMRKSDEVIYRADTK